MSNNQENPTAGMEDQDQASENDQQRRTTARQRTPGVVSRVRNATAEEKALMQAAKQQLSFTDDGSADHAAGSRGAAATRPKEGAAAELGLDLVSAEVLPTAEEFPDHTLIIERLTSIRQHKRQVLDLMDKLKSESADGEIDRDMLRKLIEAYDNFKEQEEQYILILQKILALKSEFATAAEEDALGPLESDPVLQQSNESMDNEFAARAAGGGKTRQTAPQPMQMLDSMRDSGFSSASRGGETDELQALTQQRDMLKRMLLQQRELKALQAPQAAQRLQERQSPQLIENAAQGEPDFDYDLAYQQAHDQQELLASKRRELEQLKKNLDQVRAFYMDAPVEDIETSEPSPTTPVADDDQHQRRQLEDKVRLLRAKKQQMDEILNELSALQGAESGEGQQNRAAAAAAFGDMDVPIINHAGARPKEQSVPKQSAEVGRNSRASMPAGIPQPEQIRRKLMELEATKSRLAQLQNLVTDLEDSCDQPTGQRRLGVSPQLMRLVNELEQDRQEEMGNNAANGEQEVGVNMAAYESKLNEQRDAVEKLQEEHARLTAIKNQLLKMNPLTDPLAAERAMAAAGVKDGPFVGGQRRPNQEVRGGSQTSGREISMQQRQGGFIPAPDQRLNNTRDNAYENALISQTRNRSSVGTTSATPPAVSNLDDLEHERRLRGRRDSEGSAIVNNPQLASFRRNNQLDESRKHRRPQQDQTPPIQRVGGGQLTPTDPRLRCRRSSSTIEQQYNQLQQHIDSIRLIFQDLMKEHDDYGNVGVQEGQQHQQVQHNDAIRQRSVMNDAAGRNQMVSAPPWDVYGLNSSSLAVHQQQLMLSLLACQQQLQIQQIEMRYLQQLCQELWQSGGYSDGVRTRSGSVNSIQQQQQQHQHAGLGLPFGMTGFAPFDGRPLSSASLYNLLAPNPYLTMPYYPPPPQFGPQNFAGSSGVRGGLMRMNTSNNNIGAHSSSSPRDHHQGILNNSYAMPNSSSTGGMKSNRGVVESGSGRMSSSVVCQEGHHHQRGEGMGERMILSDSELNMTTTDTTSPFKVGASSTIRPSLREFHPDANKTSKLNLENPYSKSNVNKSNNKNSNFITATTTTAQMNGAIPEMPSRASSTCGGIPHFGHGSVTPEQFDALREAIYSEVATLISQNEQRPNYLLELFRELQLLTNDYLRTRALEAIRNTLNRYLTDDRETPINLENEDTWTVPMANRPATLDESMVAAPDTIGTPERSGSRVSRNYGISRIATGNAQDYSETVVLENWTGSASESADAAPAATNGVEKPPKKRFEHLEGIKDVKNSVPNNEVATPPTRGSEAPSDVSRSQSSDLMASSVAARSGSGTKMDVTGLEQQIQAIIDDLVPFVRGNVDAECSPQMLQYIRKLVLELTALKCVPAESFTTFFRLQLSSILDDTLAKFRGQKLHECGPELLNDISEVVFNELAFFRLMQNIDRSLVQRSSVQRGTDSDAGTTTDGETRNAETSESAPLDDVSETNGDRVDTDLSSSRQSSLDEDLSPLSIPDAVSELSEDLSAITAISVSREASKMSTTESTFISPGSKSDQISPRSKDDHKNEAAEYVDAAGDMESADPDSVYDDQSRRKSTETVLMAPLMVQVTAATDEEITTTTNNSNSSSSSSPGSQSMHTAGSITSDQVDMLKTPPTGESRETTPPDDVEEVPERLEHEPTLPIETDQITVDLTVEPHPENKTRRQNGGHDEEDEEEEDEDEVENDTMERATTPVVTARAIAFVAETTIPAPDLGSADGSGVASVVTTAN